MLASFIPTPCVNQCLLVSIRDGCTTPRLKNSHFSEINLGPLRMWFSHVFNELDQAVELRAMFFRIDRGKKVVPLLMEFATFFTVVLE